MYVVENEMSLETGEKCESLSDFPKCRKKEEVKCQDLMDWIFKHGEFVLYLKCKSSQCHVKELLKAIAKVNRDSVKCFGLYKRSLSAKMCSPISN